jgi:SnoaL-like protein
METIASRVRVAMESVDLQLMRELLAPDARWGAPEQDVPTCRNAQQILAWYEMARDNGVRADITAVAIVTNHIVIGLKVINPNDQKKSRNATRWQVLTIEDELVTEIRGYETRGDATEYANSGVSNWK